MTLTWLLIVVLGIVIGVLGFGLRSRNGGLILIGVGFLVALGAIVYKAILTFG